MWKFRLNLLSEIKRAKLKFLSHSVFTAHVKPTDVMHTGHDQDRRTAPLRCTKGAGNLLTFKAAGEPPGGPGGTAAHLYLKVGCDEAQTQEWRGVKGVGGGL